MTADGRSRISVARRRRRTAAEAEAGADPWASAAEKENGSVSSGAGTSMTKRKLGLAARELSDEALHRELRHLWRTREETIFRGSAHAMATHTSRMLELEYELIAR